MTSDSMPLPQVEDLADTTFAQKISQLPGVGLVSISGGQKPAVRIMANPTALASYGMSLEQLRSVIGQVNVDQAKGQLQDNRQSFTIGANDQLFSPQGYADTIVAYKNGNPVRLSDVATRDHGRREPEPGRLDEHHAGGDPEHSAPARAPTSSRWWTASSCG